MDPQLPVVLDVDASDKYTGGVLLQPEAPFSPFIRLRILQPSMDGANLHPVAYTSRKLNPTQQRYSSQEREALGMVQALQTWQDWIEGCEIIIRTDHESLAGIRKKSNLPRRMQRFVDVLEHFDPTIVYKKGNSNHLADWLSRPPNKATSFPIARYDPVHSDSRNSPSNALPDAERLSWIDLHSIAEFLQHRVTLPENLPEPWVKLNFATHNGSTYRVIDNKFLIIHHYGKLVSALVKLHEQSAHCSIGALIRESRNHLWHPDIVLAAWGMDHTGPVRHNGQSAYLCTSIDHATSYAMALLTQSPNTASCLELSRQVHALFGIKQLITDNGQAFVSKEMSSFCKERSIEQSVTKPYRPKTNGKVERFNGIIKTIFYAVSAINPSRGIKWILDQSLSTYNRRPNSTGYSPIFLALGVPLEDSPSPYVRELTPAEETAFATDLVKLYNPR
ncbi:hypothetical protein K3495_g15328, partial [Podosphaera aphanis]